MSIHTVYIYKECLFRRVVFNAAMLFSELVCGCQCYFDVEEDPNELELCPTTLWKILRKDLGLRAYKIKLVQELKPSDH